MRGRAGGRAVIMKLGRVGRADASPCKHHQQVCRCSDTHTRTEAGREGKRSD